jgi:hypothetical protein
MAAHAPAARRDRLGDLLWRLMERHAAGVSVPHATTTQHVRLGVDISASKRRILCAQAPKGPGPIRQRFSPRDRERAVEHRFTSI